MSDSDIDMLSTALYNYLTAKEFIINAGFNSDIEWQNGVDFESVTPLDFLREAAFVIMNSGMKATVIDKYWPIVSDCFGNWTTLELTEQHVSNALKHFNNKPKMQSILKIAKVLKERNFCEFKEDIQRDGVTALQTLPYIGPIISYHLAKNIGLDVAKPDRHLVRIAESSGYKCPHTMCRELSEAAGDKIAVVDIVLWRYATLQPNYEQQFRWEAINE